MEKLLAFVIALFEAVAYVMSGSYGDLATIGAFRGMMIVVQLVVASVLVQLLDEILKNGYGLVSAISLFIATNVCEDLLWNCFSPIVSYNGEYEGAFLATLSFLKNEPNKFRAIKNSLYRSSGTNLLNVLVTVFVFLVVNFFQGFQIYIGIHDSRRKGVIDSYPIKLFYTSNMPIILQSTLISNLFFITNLLYRTFPDNRLVHLLGRYKPYSTGGQSYPVGGLIYYISPPSNINEMINNPLHAVVYVLFILISCAIFSRTWIEVSGSSPKEVAKNLKD